MSQTISCLSALLLARLSALLACLSTLLACLSALLAFPIAISSQPQRFHNNPDPTSLGLDKRPFLFGYQLSRHPILGGRGLPLPVAPPVDWTVDPSGNGFGIIGPPGLQFAAPGLAMSNPKIIQLSLMLKEIILNSLSSAGKNHAPRHPKTLQNRGNIFGK